MISQIFQRWKAKSITRRRIPSGYLAVYVGRDRARFVIPTRFLNLPVFVALLQQAEEEFGFQAAGGLSLPCEPDFFRVIVGFLEDDERRFRRMGLDEFLNAISESATATASDNNNSMKSSSSCYKESCFTTPLLHNTRV